MKKLPLNMLRAFAAVYETGGIRPAARLLGVAHSSVSRFVGELESWSQVQLIEKREGGRLIQFTPEGETLGRAVLKSMSELEQVLNKVQETHNANSVTVETTPSFASRWLLPRLHRFEEENPNIELSIVVEQRLSDLSFERSDIAIRMGKGPWPDLRCTPLMDDVLFPVMSTSYWQKMGEPVNVADLANIRLLHDRDPNGSWSLWKDAYGPETLDMSVGPRYTSSDLVLRSAEQGLGAALARGVLAKDALDNGLLIRPVADLEISLTNSIWVVQEKGVPDRWATEKVIKWLKRESA
ncbi:MAG: LysR substrate-binding domain-containing protein [Sneathiella sp.]